MRRFSTLLTLCLFGCPSQSDQLQQPQVAGIFEVTSSTVNNRSCDIEGSSQLGGTKMMLVRQSPDTSERRIEVHSCQDLDECESIAADPIPLLGDASIESGSDAEGWKGVTDLWSCVNDLCNGSLIYQTLTLEGMDGVRLEGRWVHLPPFHGGTSEAAEAAAAGQPCSTLEVTHGLRVKAL